MFYKLNVLNAKTPLRRIAPTSSKSGRADALGECASTRTVIPSTVRGETTMLDLDQAIRERHSTRLFLSQPVPRELVNEALALARMRHRTPTSSRGIWCSHLEHPGTASSPP